MAGYAARTKPSEGAVHDLWAKALALEDPSGQARDPDHAGCLRDRPRAVEPRARRNSRARYGLDRDRIVLACSHTHCGPVVGTNLLTMYKIDAEQLELDRRNYAQVPGKDARRSSRSGNRRLAEAQLSWGIGRCDFAVNRRSKQGSRRSRAAHGDWRSRAGRPRRAGASRRPRRTAACWRSSSGTPAIARSSMATSSAGTTPGSPRSSSRSGHPGAQAMFVAGCGADQNPIPRRSLELAASVRLSSWPRAWSDVLAGPLETIDGPIWRRRTKRSRWHSPPCPHATQIERDAKSTNFFVASRAEALARDDQEPRLARADLSLPGSGLAAWRADLGFSGRRGRRRLLAPDQAQPGLVAHLGFGLLQRCHGLHSVKARS